MIGFSASSEIATDPIQIEAQIAIRCSITIGTSTITNSPIASVTMPESVGAKRRANAATIARRLSQPLLRYSS